VPNAAHDPTPAASEPEVVRVHPKDILGRKGEQLAVEYLQSAGLRILDRNYRCAEGEIDIVAAERRTLVACEVKTRSDLRFGAPIEAITRQKRARLRRLAVHWVLAHGVIFDELRVDVIGVLRSPSGEFEVEHIRGVG
jgi:putative endonuclease